MPIQQPFLRQKGLEPSYDRINYPGEEPQLTGLEPFSYHYQNPSHKTSVKE